MAKRNIKMTTEYYGEDRRWKKKNTYVDTFGVYSVAGRLWENNFE